MHDCHRADPQATCTCTTSFVKRIKHKFFPSQTHRRRLYIQRYLKERPPWSVSLQLLFLTLISPTKRPTQPHSLCVQKRTQTSQYTVRQRHTTEGIELSNHGQLVSNTKYVQKAIVCEGSGRQKHSKFSGDVTLGLPRLSFHNSNYGIFTTYTYSPGGPLVLVRWLHHRRV